MILLLQFDFAFTSVMFHSHHFDLGSTTSGFAQITYSVQYLGRAISSHNDYVIKYIHRKTFDM